MSTTTVELKKNAVKVLEACKKKYGARSIDETAKRISSKWRTSPTPDSAHIQR
jgi:hypothetical protein